MVQDTTYVDTFAPSYRSPPANKTGAVAARAKLLSRRSVLTCSSLKNSLHLPWSLREFMGLHHSIMKELERKLTNKTGEEKAAAYFIIRLYIAMQQGNTIQFWGGGGRQSALPIEHNLSLLFVLFCTSFLCFVLFCTCFVLCILCTSVCKGPPTLQCTLNRFRMHFG